MHHLPTRLLGAIGSLAIRLVCHTARCTITTNQQAYDCIRGGRCILAFWHGRLLYLSYYYRFRTELPATTVLLSRSRDGDYAYAFAKGLRQQAIRGSTRRGGLQAARALLTSLSKGANVVVTPDGPRGPAFHVHKGVIWLAQNTSTPIIPVSYDAKRKWVLPTWDHFIVPRPFTKVHIAIGQPVLVPSVLDKPQMERYRLHLESVLLELDRICGDRLGIMPTSRV